MEAQNEQWGQYSMYGSLRRVLHQSPGSVAFRFHEPFRLLNKLKFLDLIAQYSKGEPAGFKLPGSLVKKKAGLRWDNG